MATLDSFLNWIRHDLSRFITDDDIHVLGEDAAPGERGISLRIYTDTNYYTIRATEREDGSRSYLGCTASCRKPRAGENWTRGSDLADGKLTKHTWRNILADIVSYEMVKVHRHEAAELPESAGRGVGASIE